MWRFSQERFLIIDKIKLYNGVEIPQVGLGTWLMNNEQVYQAFFDALSVGYIHFDTAQVYERIKCFKAN